MTDDLQNPSLSTGTLDELEARKGFDAAAAQFLRDYYASALQPEPPDPWQAFSLSDAYQERPPIEGVVEIGKNPVFEFPSLNMVYGPPGSLKSFLLADLAMCVSSGKTWLPAAPHFQTPGYPTRQGPAMWLDFDNGRRRTHDRFSALGKAQGIPAAAPLVYYSMPTPWLYSTDLNAIANLAIRIKARGAKLVCIDNLGCVLGEAEENNGVMAKVMSNFRQLAEDSGAAIVLIHHQRKGSNGDRSERAGDTLRGHSSIEASLDLSLRVEREPQQPIINIRPVKVRGADIPTIRAMFTYENGPNGLMANARFLGMGDESEILSEVKGLIIQALEDSGPMTKTKLAAEVSGKTEKGVNFVRAEIDRLVTDGKIVIQDGANNSKVCSLP